MPIDTRNIIVDQAEIPNAHQPRLPDYSRNHWREERPRKRSRALLYTALVLGSLLALGMLYITIRFVTYLGEVNQPTAWLDVLLWAGFKIVLFISAVAALFGAALWIYNHARIAGIIRLQNNQPVAVSDITNGWLRPNAARMALYSLDRFYDTDRVWAQQSGLRNLNTLDLSTSVRGSGKVEEPAALLEAPNEPAPALPYNPDLPTLAQLRTQGHIDRSGKSLLVGYDTTQKPQYIEMDDTGFIAVAGQPRVGKSSAVTLLVAQALLMRWRVVVCDKHGRKEHGLLNRLAPVAHLLERSAVDVPDIIAAIDYVHDISAQRLADDTPRDYDPILLVIDEFTGMILLEQLPEKSLAKLVAKAVEAPKVRVHGLIIGHQWTGRLLGKYGPVMRRAMTARLVMRCDPADAEFLLHASIAKRAADLATGSGIYFGGGNSPAQVAIPLLQDVDLQYVAADRSADQPTGTINAGNVPNHSAASESIRAWPTDRRMTLARIMLGRRDATTGKPAYSIHTVARTCYLRDQTVTDLAKELGR